MKISDVSRHMLLTSGTNLAPHWGKIPVNLNWKVLARYFVYDL